MSDKPFVVNDRRKFTADGELRPDVVLNDAPPEPETATGGPQLVPSTADSEPSLEQRAGTPGMDATQPETDGAGAPPPLTAEQIEGATRAYEATAERLDTAMRAADPGGERMPTMSFNTLVQSLYMQTIMQLGGGTEQGQQPRIDLLGSRQTIDMLAVVAAKTQGNLSADEQRLIDSALFEMRMGFLDVTQALARQAANRGTDGAPPAPGATGPQRVR